MTTPRAFETLNPSALPRPPGGANVSIVTGGRLVFVAGQIAQDGDGALVGAGDLSAQTEQALMNVAACLDAAGGTLADIAKLTMYVPDWEPSKMAQVLAGFQAAAERVGSLPAGAGTLLPVARLFDEAHLIEIEATAVLP